MKLGLSTACSFTNDFGACDSKRTCTVDGLTPCDDPAAAEETCNGQDDNCNGATDEGFEDSDKDGKADCMTDDDDGDSIPDGLDTCPGVIDEGGASGCQDYFLDVDADGYGVEAYGKCLCAPEDLYTADKPGDCEPINPAGNPGAKETCDDKDNDCDTVVDEFDEVCASDCEEGKRHCTAGKWGACSALKPVNCMNYALCIVEPTCIVVCPDKPAEKCNGIDDDCNSKIDDGFLCGIGDIDMQSCGLCGTMTRGCTAKCEWGARGGSTGQGVCSAGQSQSQSCGLGGTQSRVCNGSCQWNVWGYCTGQGVCASGEKTSTGCSNTCQAKVCSASCTWPDKCSGCASCNTYYQCGLGCPTSYHPTSYNYSGNCGSCCSNNQTYCVKN